MNNYVPRLVDTLIEKRLKLFGAIYIVGPKWCGKSTTAKKYAKSYLEFQDPRQKDNYLEIASSRADLLLDGEKPRLIDEWQDAPNIWDAVRYDVDNTRLKGQYILTGSTTPRKNKPKHTGTGRICKVLMYPFTFEESGDTTGEVSLQSIFEGPKEISGVNNKSLEDIAYLCMRGGWPENINVEKEDANIIPKEYLENIIHKDVNSVDNINKDSKKMKYLLKSLARNISSIVNISTLKEDVTEHSGEISEKTIASYLNSLERLYVIQEVDAWSPKLRSKTVIRTSPKRIFTDPSIAMASLGATDKDLLKDFRTFGLVFESLAIRDLIVYSKLINGEVMFYRDKSGFEVDAIVHLDNGKWGAIEVKLGSAESINEAANNLIKFSNMIDTDNENKPAFLMVLTATKYAYRREDGVYVVPLACLKS